jgi:hypothetical protein
MIVLAANILIRAVLGRHIRQLLESRSAIGWDWAERTGGPTQRQKHGRIKQEIFLTRRDRRRRPLRVRLSTVSEEMRLSFVEERPMTVDLSPNSSA